MSGVKRGLGNIKRVRFGIDHKFTHRPHIRVIQGVYITDRASRDPGPAQPEHFPVHVMTCRVLLAMLLRNLYVGLHLLGTGDCGEQNRNNQKSITMHHGISLRWNNEVYLASTDRFPFEGKTDSMEKPTIRGHVNGLPVFTPMAA